MKPESLAYLATIKHCTSDTNVHQLVDSIVELESGTVLINHSEYTLGSLNYMTHYSDLTLIRFVESNPESNIGKFLQGKYIVPVFGGYRDVVHFDRDTEDQVKSHPYVLFWKGTDDSSYYRRFRNAKAAGEFLNTHPFFDPFDHTLYLGHN